jgi:hypothetical protein
LKSPAFHELKELYLHKDKIVPGVCSLEPVRGEQPWIVCPRRLLALGREPDGERKHQRSLEMGLLQLLNYPIGKRIGVWKEVKVKYSGQTDNVTKDFDYTFDYLLMPIGDIAIAEATTDTDAAIEQNIARKLRWFERRGFSCSPDVHAAGGYVVHDYPQGKPVIVEIMTSSTSGGNKRNRTQIAQAFEDALLGRSHQGPGINYRQVWARMASQLLVKSEVALGWGGTAIWVVQDVLVDYISRSTGLNVHSMRKAQIDDVNMLSFSFGDLASLPQDGAIDLPIIELFAGSIAPITENTIPTFVDIVRLPIQPPLNALIKVLISNGPTKSILISSRLE